MPLRLLIINILILFFISTLNLTASNFNIHLSDDHYPFYSDELKSHYKSKANKYLQNYFKQQVLNYLDKNYLLPMSPSIYKTSWLITTFTLKLDTPLKTNIFLEADNNLNHYLYCGRFLPIEISLTSSYNILPNLLFQANLIAPFDNLLQLNLTSNFSYTKYFSYNLEYNLCNASQKYQGLNMRFNFSLYDWDMRLIYELNQDLIASNHIKLVKSF